jgi:hypothetical protein
LNYERLEGGNGECGIAAVTEGGNGECGIAAVTEGGNGECGIAAVIEGGNGECGIAAAIDGGNGECGIAAAIDGGNGECGIAFAVQAVATSNARARTLRILNVPTFMGISPGGGNPPYNFATTEYPQSGDGIYHKSII